MSASDVITLKNSGAKALSEGDVEDACHNYAAAVELAARVLETSGTNEVVTKELVGILFANLSLCHLRLARYEESLHDAIAATKVSPKYVKGYFRAASALIALERFDEAAGAISSGLIYSPDCSELRDLRKKNKLLAKAARIAAAKAGELGAVLVKGPGIYEDCLPQLIDAGEESKSNHHDVVACPMLAEVGIHVEVVVPSSTASTSTAQQESFLVCSTLQQAATIYNNLEPPSKRTSSKLFEQPPQLTYPFIIQSTSATQKITKGEVHALVDFIQSLCVSVDDGETPPIASMVTPDGLPLFKTPTTAQLAEWQVSYNLMVRQPLATSQAELKRGVFVDLVPIKFVEANEEVEDLDEGTS